jgi:hypothetical protein
MLLVRSRGFNAFPRRSTGTLRKTLGLAIAVLLTLAPAATAQAAPPIKYALRDHLGFDVNMLTGADVCAIAAQECRPAVPSASPGGFLGPVGVAAIPAGRGLTGENNFYVADQENHRVEELTPAGQFVAMLGKGVNRHGGDFCTAAEAPECQAGTETVTADALPGPRSVAVDPTTGDLYIEDAGLQSVVKYTPAGQFVWIIGKEVNATNDANAGATPAQKNRCTAASADVCQGATPAAGSVEPSVFRFGSGADLLSVAEGAAAAQVLYVGNGKRVEEFSEAGEWIGEIALPASVAPQTNIHGVAVDGNTGVAYIAEEGSGEDAIVHEYSTATSAELPSAIDVTPRGEAASAVDVTSLSVDDTGRLLVTATEAAPELGLSEVESFGVLYAAGSVTPLTNFTLPDHAEYAGRNTSLGTTAVNGEGRMFATFSAFDEAWTYSAVPVAALATAPSVCSAGAERETDVALDCRLNGEVNPEGVAETEAYFEWGRTQTLGERTPSQAVAVGGPVGDVIDGLRPNETFSYRLAAQDSNVRPPEQLTTATVQFVTPAVPPRVLGAPSAAFVTAASAVMSGTVNPENAPTQIVFQYARACAPEGVCPPITTAPGAGATAPVEAVVYGAAGATSEVRGLQPGTTYRYRLFAENENVVEGKPVGGSAAGPEATFTTAAVSSPTVSTGAASGVGATAATITGSVDPAGQPATYIFELGVYAGGETQFSGVFSGPAGAGSEPTPESLQISGLQPGTTYAYRIAVKSGYTPNGEIVPGEALLFTTPGLPSVLASPSSLGMLAVPSIVFPAAITPTVVGSTRKALTGAQKLTKALTACKRKPKRQQAACEKQAHKQYAKSKQANDRKKG